MLEWTNEPDNSDDEGDDEDGARAEGRARADAASALRTPAKALAAECVRIALSPLRANLYAVN